MNIASVYKHLLGLILLSCITNAFGQTKDSTAFVQGKVVYALKGTNSSEPLYGAHVILINDIKEKKTH